MTRHRLVAWVFAALLAALLAAPCLLPPRIWSALLGQGFNWPKGVLFVALAGMGAAYAYWMVQCVRWVRTLSSDALRHLASLQDASSAASGTPRGGMQGAGRMGDGATARSCVDEGCA